MTTSDNISAIETVEKAMEAPAALIERGVLRELAKHWNATGTVCGPLFSGKFGDKVPLYALSVPAMSAILAEARKAEALKREIAEKDARIAELEDELYDALQGPWPEWSEKILKLVRSYSGYDGYDDATDGVDLVGEVEEALSELYSEAERARTLLNGGSDAK